MNILHLHQFSMVHGWGGSASFLKATHRAFVAQGHAVRVVSAKCPDQFGLTDYELPFGMNLTFGPEKRPGEIAIEELSDTILARMAMDAADTVADHIVRNGKPDLILANHINLMALTSLHLLDRLGIPYRIIAFGTDTQLLLRDSRYRALFGKAAVEADRIFAISRFVAEEVQATVGGRVATMGGAVDKSVLFPAGPDHRSEGRKLVYFGRLVSEKGLWPLLKAFEQQRTDTVLKIVGEGPLRPAIENYRDRSAAKDRIELVGYVSPDKLRDVLIECAVAVVPSIWPEPLGLVVLEAMACGLPVVGTAVGGIPEMIVDGSNGRLVPPDDADALAAAISEILDDPKNFARIRDAVRRTPIKSYDELASSLIA